MKHKQRKTVNERRRKKNPSVHYVENDSGERETAVLLGSGQRSGSHVWSGWKGQPGAQSRVLIWRWSHLLAEEGSHSGKCCNSQTAHADSSHGPSVVHSGIYVCPFLLSPSSIRLILVRACSAGLQLWFLKWPSVATSEELCCDWLWAKSACFSFYKPSKLAATISPCLNQIKAPKN